MALRTSKAFALLHRLASPPSWPCLSGVPTFIRTGNLSTCTLQTARERFPVGVEPPVMLPVTSAVGWLVKYSLTSDTVAALDLRTYSDWVVRPRILGIPGIASVVSIGGGVKQYRWRSPEKLRAYNLRLADAVRALEETNRNAPGGFLVQSGQEYIVTGLGRIRANSLADVENTVVAERSGTPILVSILRPFDLVEEDEAW